MSTATTRIGDKRYAFLRAPMARERVLLLDYDGTLAPFTSDRDHAYPYEGIPELLDEIIENCDTRVVVVSGRSAEEIPFLIRTKNPLEVWGCHGLERLVPNGKYWCASLDPVVELALQRAARDLDNAGLHGLIERKPGALAVHWRGLTPSYSEAVKASAYRCFSAQVGIGGLQIHEFDRGVELRIKACNKARVVETVLSEIDREALVAYLGDDATDEDAFRALNKRGVTVLVRPTYRFTAAQIWLQPPEDVTWFLGEWIQACRRSDELVGA